MVLLSRLVIGTASERAVILGHAKTLMPPEAFLGILAHLQPHMDAAGWSKLTASVGVPADLGRAA